MEKPRKGRDMPKVKLVSVLFSVVAVTS